MAVLALTQPSFNDAVLLKLAREVAMDIRQIEDILKTYELDFDTWEAIQASNAFRGYLRGAVEEWNSATNTQERVRMKALAMVEEALPEFYSRLHDKDEALHHKNEVLKTVVKLAGLERIAGDAGAPGERLTVTINLGSAQQVRIEKDVTPKVTQETDPEVSFVWDGESGDE